MQGQLKNKQARFIIARQGLPQTLVEPKTGLEQKSLYICSPLENPRGHTWGRPELTVGVAQV